MQLGLGLSRAIRGTARPGRKTKHLIPELQRGEIAVINHPDMDPVCATALAERRVAAVINASPVLTGRYPASGPRILMDAGIPLFDCAGPDLMEQVAAEDTLEIRADGEILRGTETLGKARVVTTAILEECLAQARENISVEMKAFVHNTLEYLSEEWTLLFDERALPELRTRIAGRPVLVVVRGEGYREDLQAILPYVRDMRPVLIGVDGGADALLDVGLKPDIILGDMDSVSDAALRCRAEIIVHGYQRKSETGGVVTGNAPGLARVEQLGLKAQVLYALGTSEDVAMLLAERKGASLIVAVGSHFSLQEFLDKGRKGMSSTFLARLKVGSMLVDAKGVSKLYHRGLRWSDIAWVVLAALVLVLVVLSVSSQALAFFQLSVVQLRFWLRQLF